MGTFEQEWKCPACGAVCVTFCVVKAVSHRCRGRKAVQATQGRLTAFVEGEE